MEDMSIAIQVEGNGYVPEVYPYVVKDLGEALAASGKMDEAQDLFEDYVYGVHGLTGDVLYAYFCGTYFSAHLYLQEGMGERAKASWEDFKDYLDEHSEEYDPDELSICMRKIEEELHFSLFSEYD